VADGRRRYVKRVRAVEAALRDDLTRRGISIDLVTDHRIGAAAQAAVQLELCRAKRSLGEAIPHDIETRWLNATDIWQRFRGTWDSDFVTRIEAACVAAWGDVTAIADVISAASSGPASGAPSTTVALAARLASMPDLTGNPRARFDRDLLLVSHTAHSLARRVIEPLVVTIVAEGWSTVLSSESFASTRRCSIRQQSTPRSGI